MKKESVTNKANDFIKIMKATIWFTNKLHNIVHNLQIQSGLEISYSSFF